MINREGLPTVDQPSFGRIWFGLPILLYVLSIVVTRSPFVADTPVYASQISAAHGLGSPVLWEFGHVLWRPIGFVLSPLFLAAIPDVLAWTAELKISYGLILLSKLGGLISVVLMSDLSRRLVRHPVWALIPVIIFVWGDAFLGYCQSGAPYIPALSLLIAGVWVQLVSVRISWQMLLLAAGCIGLACLLWIPFIFVIPAAACARMLMDFRKTGRCGGLHVFETMAIAGAMVALGVGGAAFIAEVRSAVMFKEWLRSSSHDMHQNRQWLRAISGCPRLLIDLGHDGGTILKRYAFKDPYSPVSAAMVVRLTLWKIPFFYLFVASTIALISASRHAMATLGLVTLGGLPLLMFSVLWFEPSSAERFLPALPFLVLAIAAGWGATGPGVLMGGRLKWVKGFICFFGMAISVLNWSSFVGSVSAADRQAHARLKDLRKVAEPDDVLVSSNLNDPVIQLIDQRLFDPANRPVPFRNSWLINIAAGNVSAWRQQFARLVLENWREHRAIWVTKGALATCPDENAYWVERENPAVSWKDVQSFFSSIRFDRSTSLPDGFVRVLRSNDTEEQFAKISGEAGPQSGLD
jgi:hypothetical protein